MNSEDIPLPDPEDFQRWHILVYRLTHGLNRLLARLNRRPEPVVCRPVPILTLLLPGLLLTALCLILLALARYDRPETVWLYVYLGLCLFLVLWSAEMGMRNTTFALQQAGVEVFHSRRVRAFLSADIPHQAAPGWITAVVTLPVVWVVYPVIFHEPLAWPAYALTFITAFFWGHGVYIAVMTSLRFIKVMTTQDLPLYLFNPRQSLLITQISELYETVLWTTSLSVVALLVPWLFVEKGPVVNALGLSVLIGGIIALAGQFFNAQYQLSKIVDARRKEVIGVLQKRINHLYQMAEHLDKDKFTELQNLMTLHDGVVKAQSWGLSATRTMRYLSSFAPPLFTALFANNTLVLSVLQPALNVLFGQNP